MKTQTQPSAVSEARAWGRITSPLGALYLEATEHGLCSLQFHAPRQKLRAIASASKAKQLQAEKVIRLTLTRLKDYFFGDLTALDDIPIVLEGTEFQKRALSAMRKIRPGKTQSYSALASAIKHPGAARAVGSACAKNKLCLIIPCHRVVSSGGSLGGYSAGTERKKFLLHHETKRNNGA